MMSRAWAWWVALVAAAGARELDPAACASRFDVQRDKIIRTEESREMGARYLSELDVGARHECLRLCCETDACDVFVYEEKGPGSCYLFNCGPPEDFRCKFTAHSNFSSGVLALSRRLAELQDQEQRTHHERELASLRGGVTTVASSTAPATSVAPPPPASAPAHHAVQPPAPAPVPAHLARTPHALDVPPPPPPRRCSRYQFECRRGGECIAVYNACDGVPQCADGSDEAPELGCPSPPPPPPPPGPAAPPPTSQLPMKTLQESSEVMAEAGAEEAAAPPDAPPERWPHRLAQAQPPHRYSGAEAAPSSHIFSHKGGLLQEAEAAAPYAPFEPPWPRRPWPQPGADSMAGERGWSAGGAGAGAGGAGGEYARLDWPEPDPRRAWPVPQHRPDPDMSVYLPPKTMPEVPMVYSSQQQTLRDSPKKGFELNKKPEGTAPPPPPPPPAAPPAPLRRDQTPSDAHLSDTNKFPKDKPSDSRKPLGEGSEMGPSETSEGKKAGVPSAHQHYAPDDHDGLSERPPAAVLLLVLGVLMTAAMGAMLGCRARAARRRLRRGKSPFAHDADYLVNGMYL
ncbi:low-density lipoprotein receptor-related protein 11 isoform X2 [Manduca sexta]|uniref:low-density lipoprotein receptor-related protein 11 isoform X2 n=1 Tax=Manduca sexta TaxID=7130 RepID=UPI00188DF2FC|nr:low-density lipoprotein receptor-related protein 11 isoform X2 [Manduca sexta]